MSKFFILDRRTVVVFSLGGFVLSGLLYSSFEFLPSFAQSTHSSYKSAYPMAILTSSNPFTVQSQFHIYRPGDTVNVAGSISPQLNTSVGGATQVLVTIRDSNYNELGRQTANLDNNCGFTTAFVLPPVVAQGQYTLWSRILVTPSLQSTLKSDVAQHLQSPFVSFEVVNPTTFGVKAADKDVKISIASTSSVSAFNFDQSAGTVSFKVAGQPGIQGVTQLSIPKSMLGGEMTVTLDGNSLPDSDVVEISTDTLTTLEINYHHSTHDVVITGTNVVPEFPIAMLVMPGAIGVVIIIAAVTSKISARFGSH